MHETIERLLSQRPVITDGAWGTQLQARGLEPGMCPEIWNLDHPDRVTAVAAEYAQAGSRIILSNSFGANRVRLTEFALAERTREINVAAARLSREGAASQALVFASIGPSGKMLMMGEVSEAQLDAVFEEQAAALAEGGAAGLVVETMADLAEAVVAVAAARRTGLPVVASVVFDSGKDLDRTMMGTTPEAAVKALEAAGADVVGANCGQGIETCEPLCRRLRQAATVPLWIKPNAGAPEIADGNVRYHTTPGDFAAHGPALAAAGADFIGGCCGTTPAFIAALQAVLRATG